MTNPFSTKPMSRTYAEIFNQAGRYRFHAHDCRQQAFHTHDPTKQAKLLHEATKFEALAVEQDQATAARANAKDPTP